MGQSSSFDRSDSGSGDFTLDSDSLPHTNNPENLTNYLHEQIRKHSLTLRQLSSLNYEDFQQKICELNVLSSKYVDCNGKQLLFEIKSGSDTNVLWKGTVRIKCVKLEPTTQTIEKSRELNLKQFLQVYNTLQLHLTAGTPIRVPPPPDQLCCTNTNVPNTSNIQPQVIQDMNASILFDKDSRLLSPKDEEFEELECGLDLVDQDPEAQHLSNLEPQHPGSSYLDSEPSSAEECCICMESKPEVILPCTHSYCLACIEQWNFTHKTCPICREKLETTDDTWVLEDTPNPEEVSQEIRKSLFGLTR